MSPDDTSRTRRAVLASTGAIAFAGCTGRLSRNDDTTPSGATTASTGDSTDWAQMGRTAAKNGYVPEFGAETEPSVAWKTTVDGSLTTPTVVDDTVYVTRGAPAEDGPEASLEAYALDTGERRWSRSLDSEFEYNAPFSNHRPVVYDGSAYVTTTDEVVSVDLETRDIRWRATMDPFFNHPPTVTDDGPYVTAGTSVVALDHAGDERWRHTVEGRRRFRVVAVDEYTVYAPFDGRLLAIDAASGELRWEHAPENGLSLATPAVTDDSVVSASFGGVERVSTDGTREWLADGPDEDLLRPVVGAGMAFAAGLYGTVTAYDLASGERLWQTNVGDGEWTQETAPILLDDSVIVPQSDGTEVSVHALDVTSGEERWSVSASAARIRGPVAASGHCVATSQDGHVNTGEKTAESVPTGAIRAYEFEN